MDIAHFPIRLSFSSNKSWVLHMFWFFSWFSWHCPGRGRGECPVRVEVQVPHCASDDTWGGLHVTAGGGVGVLAACLASSNTPSGASLLTCWGESPGPLLGPLWNHPSRGIRMPPCTWPHVHILDGRGERRVTVFSAVFGWSREAMVSPCQDAPFQILQRERVSFDWSGFVGA